jgi:hypothetical protein
MENQNKEKTKMNNLKNEGLETMETKVRSIKGWRMIFALLLVAIVSVVPLSAAADQTGTVTPPVARTLSALQGTWVATIVGTTGCGLESMIVQFTLDSAGKGSGTATIVGHGQCGNYKTSGLDFNITSLNANGTGSANLSCGTACGWDLRIEVARSNDVFNLVDVSPANPNNYIAGTAIKQ